MKTTKEIDVIIEALKNDTVVIVPTDTIYGYSCTVDSRVAIEKIKDLKQRDRDKPFLILDSNLTRVKNYFSNTSNSFMIEKFIDKLVKEKIWPNNLTLISKKNPILNELPFLKNVDTVAVRYTDNKVIKNITDSLNSGILSTSINISGEKELIQFTEIIGKYSNEESINYILETNEESEKKINRINSTIIKLDINSNNDNILNIIREGHLGIVKKVKLLFEKDFIL